MRARNIIKSQDTISGVAYDRDGKALSTCYDDGFTSIEGVIQLLKDKSSGWCKDVKKIRIHNIDRDTIGYYTGSGKLINK